MHIHIFVLGVLFLVWKTPSRKYFKGPKSVTNISGMP